MLGKVLTKQLLTAGYHTVAVTREHVDATEPDLSALEPHLDSGTTVINCIGLPPRTPPEDLLAVNAVFPRRLAAQCAARGARLIHVSTNGVFAGNSGGYTELAVPDATDAYGISKLLGEPPQCMVLRTSIIGYEGPGGRYLLAWALGQHGQAIPGFVNHRWNGVTTVALARGVIRILADDLYDPGVFHLHASDSVSKYELLDTIREVFGVQLTIVPTRNPQCTDLTLASVHPLSNTVIGASVRHQVEELRRSLDLANHTHA
jgi:dTDP-4-dehydrorhamnose reductase